MLATIAIFFVTKEPSVEPKKSSEIDTVSPTSSSKNTEVSFEKLVEKNAHQGAQSDVDQLEQTLLKETAEMDNFIKSSTLSSSDKKHMETEAEEKSFEELVAKAEQAAGKSFDVDINKFHLDPVKDKEAVELDQEFDALDEEMLQILDKM